MKEELIGRLRIELEIEKALRDCLTDMYARLKAQGAPPITLFRTKLRIDRQMNAINALHERIWKLEQEGGSAGESDGIGKAAPAAE